MAVAGVGGLLGGLFFPGLDDRLARTCAQSKSAGPAGARTASGYGRRPRQPDACQRAS